MVKLVKNRVNKIPVVVTAIIGYAGFSATLELNGATKTISNLKVANPSVEFTEDEIESIGADGAVGLLTVRNDKGEVHTVCQVNFSAVDDEREAAGFQKIYLTLVSLLKYMGSRRSGGGDDPSDPATKADVQRVQDSVDAVARTVSVVSQQVTEVAGSVDKILYNNWDESDEELHIGG